MRNTLGLATVGLGVALLAWSGYEGTTPVPGRLRVGTNVWLGYEPLHVRAAAGKLDPRFGAVEFVSASQVMRAFENGDIDAAALELSEALRLSAATRDAVLLLLVDESDGADGLIVKPPRDSVAQLRGARVGVERSGPGAHLLARALERAGLAPGEITVVPLNVNEHEDAWGQDQLHALVTFDPVLSRLRSRGGLLVFSSRDIPGEIVDVLVVRRSVARRSPELATQLRSEWVEALHEVHADRPGFSAAAAARLGTTPAGVEQLFSTLRLPEGAGEAPLPPTLRTLAHEIVKAMRSQGLSVTAADADALFEDVP